MDATPLVIRPVEAADHAAARRLVLAGLGEHFGAVDETRNPDLDDIAAAYTAPGHVFVVADIDGRVAGTGALVAERPGVGRLVRMSVAHEFRRRGIGRALVANLCDVARGRGYRRLVLETNDDWHDAIRLYRACGFVEVGRANGEIHFALELSPDGPE